MWVKLRHYILTNIQIIFIYKPNKIKKDIISEKSPIASDKANPKIAYEKSCGFNDGLRAWPMIKLPKTVPIPAPDPAQPTVAAPAPINLAACSISRLAADVCSPAGTSACILGSAVDLNIGCCLTKAR